MSRALFLIGSPKPGRSASRAFAGSLAERLDSRGWETRMERITPAYGDEARTGTLLDATTQSDLVVLAFPVYVDSLPAPVLALLEAWAAALHAASPANGPRPRLAVLTLCGFPEASHCDVAVEVCRLFAHRCGLEWAGALAFGMGPSIEAGIERSPLAGRVAALDAAADALVAGAVIPAESTEEFARPLVPSWTYPLIGGLSWRRQARRNGCTESLKLRRYAP